ncbi:hypothetical protein WDU94_001314 [Cyamophila willieti]
MKYLDGWFGQLTEDWFLATELYDALVSQNVKKFKSVLKKGANPNTIIPEFGLSIIHMICTLKCSPSYASKFLDSVLDHGKNIDLNQKTTNGLTPLLLTIKYNRLSLAHKLLEAGADIKQMELIVDSDCIGNGNAETKYFLRSKPNKGYGDPNKWYGDPNKDHGDCNSSACPQIDIAVDGFDISLQNLKTSLEYCSNHPKTKDRFIEEIDCLLAQSIQQPIQKILGSKKTDLIEPFFRENRRQKFIDAKYNFQDCQKPSGIKNGRSEIDDRTIQRSDSADIWYDCSENRSQYGETRKASDCDKFETFYNCSSFQNNDQDDAGSQNRIPREKKRLDFMSIIETEEFKSYLSKIIFNYRSTCEVYETCSQSGPSRTKKKSKLTL